VLITSYVVFQLSYELQINQPAVDTIKIRQSDLPVTATCNVSGWGSKEWVRSAAL
jgi:hypothetical protein